MASKNNQPLAKRGFTLTEAAIVLGIVGLILGAIWVAASAVYGNLRVNAANKQLIAIVQNVRSLYASSALMDTINAGNQQVIINACVFPNDTNPTGTLGPINGWGGSIQILTQTRAAAGDSFAVSFAEVPREACIDIAVSNSGTGRDAGLIGVGPTPNTTGGGVPSTPTSLNGSCGAATGNTLVFTFNLKG